MYDEFYMRILYHTMLKICFKMGLYQMVPPYKETKLQSLYSIFTVVLARFEVSTYYLYSVHYTSLICRYIS